ncbi:TPR-like protein [Melanomma pulvis-pyrius CBS 109.77]|uniref:TPR-like protein n=1 Tax=Melanomma pulvis-pyrius CBS 109.77 TaxID=1314802 RepID=A0A6A6X1J6_9PLEO|nr:TPR-like protein [Melanomma pulvis-pyrius CBS 109.77]
MDPIMASLTTPSVLSYLRNHINYALDNNLLAESLFFAERLHFEDRDSADSAFLLSLCHLRARQFQSALECSRAHALNGEHLGCAYIFAQASLELEEYVKGIEALENCEHRWQGTNHWNKHTDTCRQHLPDAAAVYCLLGKLLHRSDRKQRAAEAFREALRLNPFLWSALVGFCDTRTLDIHLPEVYQPTAEMLASTRMSSPIHLSDSSQASVSLSDHFHTDPKSLGDQEKEVQSSNQATSPYRVHLGNLDQKNVPQAPVKRKGPHAGLTSDPRSFTGRVVTESLSKPRKLENSGKHSDMLSTIPIPARGSRLDQKRTASGLNADPIAPTAERRSARLMNQFRDSKTKTLASSTSKSSRELKKPQPAGSRKPASAQTAATRPTQGIPQSQGNETSISLPAPSKMNIPSHHLILEVRNRTEALLWILDLMKLIATGYYHSSLFQCAEAIQAYTLIPLSQQDSPWILRQIARAYLELGAYSESATYFENARSKAPTIVKDMDIYSTVLWHLKREVELSMLARSLVEANPMSPETWCATGNAFSLQQDHVNALECFEKSTELDKKFAYGFTLQGHEHRAISDLENASHAYTHAIAANKTHYNAWFGMGLVHFAREQYDQAWQYFGFALKINPNNSVLLTHAGITFQKRRDLTRALQYFSKACDKSPDSIFARQKKVEVLLQLKNSNGALKELEALQGITNDDNAGLHLLFGQAYRMKHDLSNAIKRLTYAHSLDPSNKIIKEELACICDDTDTDEVESG